MASLSLPRVLQQRKTSLEIERENFEKSQQTAISKAINNLETPVKQKHVRSTIIGTYQEKGAQTFWIVVLRLPLQDDRIIAWKFCHVLHNLLREGYHGTILHSQRHRSELENLGKYWVHLRDCYGKLIQLYCSLLIAKLDFHKRNPRFPGGLTITYSELENIAENDINNYFEMSVEMFDYMDAILDLQTAIFGSLDKSRSNSMTSSGQCRLSPLIPCIQDASKLYDFCVKILFKLHSALPPDTLSGHRERFLKQFKELKLFYQNTNMLHYFRNLITIPSLPENPPNFLIQSELRTYVTPVVIIPPEEPDTESVVEGSLIDTSESVSSDTIDSNSQNGTISPSQNFTEIIAERDYLIDHLQQENKNLRLEIQFIKNESKKIIEKLEEQITVLETELATRESELIQERQIKEDLFQQATATQNHDSEQKLIEEKFEKLKNRYIKVREDHVQLLRKNHDIVKNLDVANKLVADIQLEKNKMENELKLYQHEKNKEKEQFQEATDKQSTEIKKLKEEYDTLVSENELLKIKIEKYIEDKNSLDVQLQDLNREKQQLEKKLAEVNILLNNSNETIEKLKQENEEKMKDMMLASILESEKIMKKTIDEIDNPALSGVTCSPDYFCTLTEPSLEALNSVYIVTRNDPSMMSVTAIRLAHTLSLYILKGCATSNISPDIIFGEKMATKCKQLGTNIISILQGLYKDEDISDSINRSIEEVKAMSELAETLQGTLRENPADLIADLVENELASMDKAIEEAANMIQEMLSKSRAADSGIKLEVNEKLLDSCTKLMQAIRVLIKKSRLLQAEIVAQGKGSASIKEFYKRNHRWTDGLISAAKAVGTAAGFLLNSADKVVCGNGKLEQLAVAAQEIAASTAQLVVASRVKAERNSTNLQQLSQASHSVTTATGEVVATVKDCAHMIEEQDEFDASKLTLHMAKRLEMDTQIRVLELEKELEQNRFKLSALRRQHYQLAGESEGWVS